MIFFDSTEPDKKNKIFFAANGNKAGIVFIDCNVKVISSGFAELTEAIIAYARKKNKFDPELLGNVIHVFKRIIDLIVFSKKHWKSMKKISIGVICTFTEDQEERIVYNIIAPPFFPVEKIEQLI